jgi:peptide-methionine (S)-S-oxide reductase
MKELYLAAGCFWGVEEYFRRVKGVVETSVGYANGDWENPSYEDVCTGLSGYAETAHIKYDEAVISIEEILDKFWKIVDPTSVNKQGNDRGSQYRSGIYYIDDDDYRAIMKSLRGEAVKYDKPIVTEVEPLKNYFLAEEYHQKYLEKNPNGYCHIDLNDI